MELEGLNIQELQNLKLSIDRQLATRKAAEFDKLQADIIALCTERGFALQDVLKAFRKQPARPVRAAGPVVNFVKGTAYRNPANPTQVWQGFGGRPAWLKQHLDNGGTVAQLTPALEATSTEAATPAASPPVAEAPMKTATKKPVTKKPAPKKR